MTGCCQHTCPQECWTPKLSEQVQRSQYVGSMPSFIASRGQADKVLDAQKSPFKRIASLGCVILPLSPGLRSTLGALGRMVLHLSHAFALLVSHLSPTLTLVCLHSACPGPRHFLIIICLPLVSRACLPLRVLWAAWFYTCLPLVSRAGCCGPRDFTLVSHLSPTGSRFHQNYPLLLVLARF